MRNIMKWLSVLAMLAGSSAGGYAIDVVKTDDVTLSLGGRIQEMGEMEYVSDDTVRDPFRVYLFNIEDRLFASGSFKDYNWRIETSFGGETNAASTSSGNGLLDLKDAYVDIPILQDTLYVKVGQFKDPSNLESAVYEGDMLFGEKSPYFNLFFNSGYEMGLALACRAGAVDGELGLVQGAPNLPQRFLPEELVLPIPMFLRVGVSDGIADDPFHEKQTNLGSVDQLQWAAHANGFVAADSNAGHSDLFSQMGGGLKTMNFNSDQGNVMLSSVFNPYIGAFGLNFVNALYYQTGADFQVRAPLSEGWIYTVSGQFADSYFTTTTPAGTKIEGVTTTASNTYTLNVYGGELIASVEDLTWALAGRLVVVMPDPNMQGTTTNTTTFRSIFPNNSPITEVTFPSATYKFNGYVKLTAETIFIFNGAEAQDVDGNYLVAEMPGTASGTTYRAPNISSVFVPIARMMLQVQF